MLKKAASGVLALLPCSRTKCTLRASKGLRPCWTDFFEHSLSLMLVVSPDAFIGSGHEIFNRPIIYFSTRLWTDPQQVIKLCLFAIAWSDPVVSLFLFLISVSSSRLPTMDAFPDFHAKNWCPSPRLEITHPDHWPHPGVYERTTLRTSGLEKF